MTSLRLKASDYVWGVDFKQPAEKENRVVFLGSFIYVLGFMLHTGHIGNVTEAGNLL